MWQSTGKPGTTRHPLKNFFLHLQSCRHPDIELSKFYCRSLSRSHYNRPNRSLPSAWNNTFLRNQSIFSRYLRTPRCARFSCRRSQIYERQSDQLEHSYFEKTAIKTSYSISRGVNVEFRNLTGSPRYELHKTVTYAWKMVAISWTAVSYSWGRLLHGGGLTQFRPYIV